MDDTARTVTKHPVSPPIPDPSPSPFPCLFQPNQSPRTDWLLSLPLPLPLSFPREAPKPVSRSVSVHSRLSFHPFSFPHSFHVTNLPRHHRLWVPLPSQKRLPFILFCHFAILVCLCSLLLCPLDQQAFLFSLNSLDSHATIVLRSVKTASISVLSQRRYPRTS